jgi:hypothetical protein
VFADRICGDVLHLTYAGLFHLAPVSGGDFRSCLNRRKAPVYRHLVNA